MNIKKLEIHNFKCFLEQSFAMNNLTVLAGSNAVGKSTFIQSLLLIRQTIDKIKQLNLLDDNSYNLEKKLIKIKLNKIYELSLGNSKTITSSNGNSSKVNFLIDFGLESISFDFETSKKNPEQSIYYIINHKFLEVLKKYNHLMTLLSDSFYYLNAERNGPREIQYISDFEFDHTGYRGEYTGYILYKIGDTFHVENVKCLKGDIKLLKKQVEFWMDYVVPGTEINPEIYENLNAIRLGIRKRSSGTDYLNPPNIGFGISYSLPIIVNGLIANKNSIFIVENPEAHLHPAAQSKIGYFLAQMASSGVQIIIETHSEHIINGIRIAVLRKTIKNDLVTLNYFNQKESSDSINIEEINLNEKADLSHWPTGFFDQQEKDLSQIFKLKKNGV